MMGDYKYGDQIPEQYREHLYEWDGGGYSGCFWECNQGLVDKDGHWRPIFSTGRNGIDCDDWFESAIRELKAELGYSSVESVGVQFERSKDCAMKAVFGEQWYSVKGASSDDPRVREFPGFANDVARYGAYVSRRKAIQDERVHRQDALFMQVVTGESKRDNFNDIGSVDDEHIKGTCREFCHRYRCNAGMMTRCLDELVKMGYDPWCTCSDCGEQFQLCDYECFARSLDENAYHGDGGIGVIMTRVLCDACREYVACPMCGDSTLPNVRCPDHGDENWRSYDLLSCVLHDWIGVCDSCADGYCSRYLSIWDNVRHLRVPTSLGLKWESFEDEVSMKYHGDERNGHLLYEEIRRHPDGRAKINGIRDILESSVCVYFDGDIPDGDYGSRLNDSPIVQLELADMYPPHIKEN